MNQSSLHPANSTIASTSQAKIEAESQLFRRWWPYNRTGRLVRVHMSLYPAFGMIMYSISTRHKIKALCKCLTASLLTAMDIALTIVNTAY
jgi:hypothetical protein